MKVHRLVTICMILALSLTTVGRARADDFLELEIGGGVIVPWDIDNVVPGASGVIDVTIHNAGNINGYIAVWVDTIVDTEGNNTEAETGNTDEPGELSQHLTLSISGDYISPYTASPAFRLPVTLCEFPGDSGDPLQLREWPIMPGETIQVQWEWAIPPETTNIIQGDRVSFNVNYILTEHIIVTKKYGGGGGGALPIYDDDSDTQEHDIDESTEDIPASDIEDEEQDTEDTGVTDIVDDSESSGVIPTVPAILEPDSPDTFEGITPSDKDEDLKSALPGPEDVKSKTYVIDWFASLSPPVREILHRVSLIVAISGTLAMAALAYIERKRRNSRRLLIQAPKIK